MSASSVLPVVAPESVGLSSARLERMMAALNAEVTRQKLPGGVVTIARHGKLACFEAFGRQDPEHDKPMTRDSIFRIYSMTKPIVSVAAMMLVEQGRLLLGNAVSRFVPEFAAAQVATDASGDTLVPLARPITVHDLLRHTSGLTYDFMGASPIHKKYTASKLFGLSMPSEVFNQTLATMPLLRQPGTAWGYSHSTDVVGRVIEVITGQSLGDYLREALFAPLGMVDTAFHVPEPQHHRIAEPYRTDPDSGVPIRVFNLHKAHPFQMGGAGLASTAADYARFMQFMLNGGILGETRLLSRKTVELMTADHLGSIPVAGELLGPGYGFGLGFAVRKEAGVVPGAGSAGLYYWAGLAGTSFFIDPKEGLHAQFMIQQPGRRDHYRALFRELVYAAIAD